MLPPRPKGQGLRKPKKDDAVDETCSDEQLADFVGQPDTAFVHSINIRRILYRSGLLG